MADNIFHKIKNTVSGAFLEAFELLEGDEDKVKQLALWAIKNAHDEYLRRHRPSSSGDEMTFDEIRDQLLHHWPFGDQGATGDFRRFLRSGCTEAEAKRWLGEHIWDFDDATREKLTIAFAADALHQAAKRPAPPEEQAPKTLAEYERRYKEIFDRGGFAPAWDFAEKYNWWKRK